MPIRNKTLKMQELLDEPALAVSGLGAEATTATDTNTFLRDPDDANSDVVLTRERGFEAGGALVRSDAWALSNEPTITACVTNQANNDEVGLTATNILTINGNTFAAAEADLEVIAYFVPENAVNGPHPTRGHDGRIHQQCVVTASANLDDAAPAGNASITATLKLPQIFGGRVAAKGPITIVVVNKKRKLESPGFTGLTVV